MDLFSTVAKDHLPLAERMRASTFQDFLGQEHLIFPNSPLLRAIETNSLGSCIFYGPPGTGKTTLANIIANKTNGHSVKLNAVSSGVADAKKVIDESRELLSLYNQKTYLILDECHRWNKAQSDSVLGAIEKGEIVFIGTTTENPYANMTRAIVSRCKIYEFKKLKDQDIIKGLKKALLDKEKGLGLYNASISNDALEHIAFVSNGDLRAALNSLEIAVITTPPQENSKINITKKIVENVTNTKTLSIDRDTYYDVLSAFCKSLRGSDVDAALYYAFRLINAGVDPLIIFRRLIVHSAEDVGLADPNALVVATNALVAFEKIGIPEGFLLLSEAIIYVSNAPKSNSVLTAMNLAKQAVKTNPDDSVPAYLQDQTFKIEKQGQNYLYPHDYEGGWVKQQYLPDGIKNERFYFPSLNGEEINIKIKKEGE
ncbi:MAG TPA: replication-associated recombination protein A [Clostridiales bacterium]|nr:replication-associated recombination protein A [Clostridiales bacterium]